MRKMVCGGQKSEQIIVRFAFVRLTNALLVANQQRLLKGSSCLHASQPLEERLSSEVRMAHAPATPESNSRTLFR